MTQTSETTVGHITTKAAASVTAAQWHNPEIGYHTQVIAVDGGFICRLVIND